jgi:hypothetical protein
MDTDLDTDRATPERRYEDLQGLYERLSDRLASTHGVPDLDLANALARTSLALSALEDAFSNDDDEDDEEDEDEDEDDEEE